MSITLTTRVDAVVMLTLSDWRTEMRSNRYHYATRFAKHLPVIFVQPDLDEPCFYFEATEVHGVAMLHVYKEYGWKQAAFLKQALGRMRILKPLLWVYNHQFIDFIAIRHAPCTVYHATEDYFSPDFGLSDASLNDLRTVLRLSDVLVAVSEGVKNSYAANGHYAGAAIVVENGCDFKFWASHREDPPPFPARPNEKRIAFYQGGIHRKIDLGLLQEVVSRMPDWEFWFCGEAYPDLDGWASLIGFPNVTYFGKLSPEGVRDLAQRATVGLIPFIQSDWIIERSFPLKAFEYVACGLPVVSVPIKALQQFSDVMTFAENTDQFMSALQQEASTRHDAGAIARRLKVAQSQDYDLKFDALVSGQTFLSAGRSSQGTPSGARFLRFPIIIRSFWKGLRRDLSELKRAFALAAIHYCAWTLAAMVKTDPERLEEEFLRLGRKVKSCGR